MSLLFSLLLFWPVESRADNLHMKWELATGFLNACLLVNNEVTCWGNGPEGENKPPRGFTEASGLTVGFAQSCVIEFGRASCWGRPSSRKPKLNAISSLSIATDELACAVDAQEGAACWTSGYYNYYSRLDFLVHPGMIRMDANTCAIDGDDVKCWNSMQSNSQDVPQPKREQFPPRHLPGVRLIDTKGAYACALANEVVSCWQLAREGDPQLDQDKITEVPNLLHPRMVSLGHGFACAIDDLGLHCWGKNYQGEMLAPALSHPIGVSVHDTYACALDDDGVKCWGRDYPGNEQMMARLRVAESATYPSQLYLDQLPRHFSHFSRTSGDARSRYFSRLGDWVGLHVGGTEDKVDLDHTRYLALWLAAPAVRSVDSTHYKERLIPALDASVREMNAALGFMDEQDALAKIPGSDRNRALVLESLRASIESSIDFVPDSEGLRTALRLVGQGKVTDLVPLLRSLSREKEILRRFVKSAFLAETMDAAAAWLEKKTL